MRAARIDPCCHALFEVGLIFPHQAADGQVGHLVRVLDQLDLLHDEAQAIAHVDHGYGDGFGRGDTFEHEAGGVRLAADAERVHLDLGLGGGELRGYFQHMRAQAEAVGEVVGVVFHQARALLPCHILHGGAQRRDLPVAFGAEAVALALQVLNGEAGQLVHAVQRAEVIDDADIAALVFAEFIDGDLVLRLFAHDVDAVGGHGVLLGIFRHQSVHLGVGDDVDIVDKIAHGIVIDLPAEVDVRFHLVALGDGDVAHVIGEAADLELFGEGVAGGDFAPGSQLFEGLFVFIIADDHLIVHAQARHDVAEFAVAVGSLVLVHEVHVDGVVRQLFVVLGGEVAHGLLQLGKAADPHLRRGEGVAPGDDADAVVVGVDLFDRRFDLVGALAGGQVLDGDGHMLVDVVCHLFGVLRDVLQHVGAVQRLRACDPIDDFFFHFIYLEKFLFCLFLFRRAEDEYDAEIGRGDR